MNKTLVFMPAYNEEGSLGQTIAKVRLCLPEVDILVVDDGSTDHTAQIAKDYNVLLYSFEKNMGLTFAVAKGYEYADANSYDFCGRVDSDGQHPPAELKRLLAKVQAGHCDVAFGSRFLTEHKYDTAYIPLVASASSR